MDYAYISKPGTRDNNEDSALAIERNTDFLFIVADGLGGHGKGEVASALVIESFKECFDEGSIAPENFIQEAIMTAQNRIIDEQREKRASHEMKSTCASLLISHGKCHIGHVGDTRVYVMHRNKIILQTLDHSVPQMLVMYGDIKEKHIRNHPDRNRLLRVIGVEWESPQHELAEMLPLIECQAFLLCTDGFWELCDEKKMCSYLKKSRDADEWLNLMVEEIEKNGKDTDMDNYTAIAVIC